MKTIRLPLGAGSEPELIEIDDAHEAVGDTGCMQSPNGQHEFKSSDNHRRCIYCREVIR